MKRYRKILVALTGSSADSSVLSWARLIAEPAGTEHVEVLILDPEPAAWLAEYPPVKDHESLKDRVHETAAGIAEVFGGLPHLTLNTKVSVGSALPTILRELLDANCDLIVVGVADDEDRRLAEKLARKSPASVLSVPAGSGDRCDAILSPVDFSEPSFMALDVAAAFGRSFGSQRLTCVHSLRIPDHAGRVDLPQKRLVAEYRKAAQERLSDFLARKNTSDLPIETIVREAPIPSAAVLDELKERPCDLVVMATRGRSSLAPALLGSNTADVIRHSPVPVLALKAKGEGLSFLRALLGKQEVPSTEPAHSA